MVTRFHMKYLGSKLGISFAVLIGLLHSIPVANAVEVSAFVDRNPIYLDESVTLVLTAEDESTNIPVPDLEPLRADFEILSQSTQTNINIVNSVPNVVQSWVIEIQPKRLGVIEIPSLMIAGAQTQPIQLEVQKYVSNIATEGAEIFLEVDVSSNNPYVQSQLNLTSRLYYSIPIVNGTLSDPQIPFATVEGSAQERRYNSRRAGVDYRVIERQYAVFPEQSGSFTIAPIEFACVIERIDPVTNLRRHFRERYSSKPVQLEVKPIPRSYSGSTWLPAQDLQLTDSWNGRVPDFEVGRPESREISIDALGLRAIQLPLVEFEENSTARIYAGSQSDQKTSPGADWLVSRRTDEFAIVPKNDANVELPKVEVVWWDVNEDREKVAVLPAISASMGEALTQLIEENPVGANPDGIETLQISEAIVRQDQPWKLISLALLGIWLLTLLMWLLSGRYRRGQLKESGSSQVQNTESERQLFRRIKQECENGDAATISKVLLGWAEGYWTERPPKNLIELGRRLQSEELMPLLEDLDRALYSADGVFVHGLKLWKLLTKVLRVRTRQVKQKRRFTRFWKRARNLEELWPDQGSTYS